MADTRAFEGRGGAAMWGAIGVAALIVCGVDALSPMHEPVTGRDRFLLLGRRGAGVPSLCLAVAYGLTLVAPLVGAVASRVTSRAAMAHGMAGALAIFVGYFLLHFGVAGFGFANANPLGAVALLLVFLIGFLPPAIVAATVGAATGVALRDRVLRPVTMDETVSDMGLRPAEGTTDALRRQTEIVQSDLEGDRGPLSARQTTLVFEWVQDLRSFAAAHDHRPAELGLDEPGLMQALERGSAADRGRIVSYLHRVVRTLSSPSGGAYREDGRRPQPANGGGSSLVGR